MLGFSCMYPKRLLYLSWLGARRSGSGRLALHARVNRCRAGSSPLPTIDGMTRELADGRDREPPSLSLLRTRRDEIMRIAVRRGVSNVRVFGSVARGDARPDSDVDLLVDFDQCHRGLDLLGFEREVEELIGYRVEVGTEVHPSVRARVDSQAVPL